MVEVPYMPPLESMPEAFRDLKKDRHRLFAWNYVFNGANGSAAAITAGFSDSSGAAKVTAHHLLQRDDVQAAIKALTTRYLFSLAPKAVLRLEQLLDDPKHPKHDKAIEMTLSRSGHGDRSHLDVNVTGSVTVNHTDSAIEDLRRLKALGAPREKLVEVFGHTGLDRYEKMLSSQDAKLIEHREVE